MALLLAEEVGIATRPEAVWKLLVDPAAWTVWWTDCQEARTVDGRPLREGSELLLVLRPSWLRLRLAPRIEALTEGRLLIWSSRSAGLGLRLGWFLETRPAGSHLRQQLTFAGPGLTALRLLGQTSPLRRMARANLRALRKLAERAV